MTPNRDNIKTHLARPTLQPWTPGADSDKDIAVLMSGGVDSSVTALLLKRSGWNPVGITMKIPTAKNCDYRRSCCGMEAAYVCKDLGIPHYYLDVQDAFERFVIVPFRESYARGETPSPCVDCNTLFKFSMVWDFIKESFGIKHMATGHYARVLRTESGVRLARARDLNKDQSYFLYGIPRERLEYFRLPLGEFAKEEVRAIAKDARLPVARRPESMELCFAGAGDYRNVLGETSRDKGRIVDSSGRVLGEHTGIANYTIGQRKGIGIAADKPLYVTRISPEENTITVGPWDEALQREVRAGQVNVLVLIKLTQGARLLGKIRSHGNPTGCTVLLADDELLVEFDEPQFAPTPGQRLVLYNGEGHVVAGGTIK